MITVLGFYSTKEKVASSTSIECDSSGQVPMNHTVNPLDLVDFIQQNSNEMGNPSDSDTSVKNCNACFGITPLTHTLYDTNPSDNGVFNGINTQSISSNKAISDFNAQLKDIDKE